MFEAMVMDADDLSMVFANEILPVTVFFSILAVLGAVGNLCVLYAYKYKYPAGNFRTFVICLATTDFVSCLFVFPCEIVGHRIWFSYPKSAAWFCKVKTLVFAMSVMTTSLILLLIAIDRFRKVCHPFESQIKPKTALQLCFLTLCVSFIMNIPIPILFGIQTENITFAGNVIQITSCEKDDAYKETIWMTLWAIVLYYTPVISFMVTTSVLYSLILRKIYSRHFLSTSRYSNQKMKEKYFEELQQSVLDSGVCYPLTKSFDISETDETKTKANNKSTTIGKHETDNVNIENRSNNLRPPTINKENSRNNLNVEHNENNEQPLSINRENSRNNLNIVHDLNALQHTSLSRKLSRNLQTAELHCVDDIHEEDYKSSIGREAGQNTNDERKLIGRNKSFKIEIAKPRVTRKTTIMFVVTIIFNITTLIYFCVLFVVVRREHIFHVVTKDSAGILFLCWRIYFINHVINPVVYGLLDQRFRAAFKISGNRE